MIAVDNDNFAIFETVHCTLYEWQWGAAVVCGGYHEGWDGDGVGICGDICGSTCQYFFKRIKVLAM